MQKKSFLCGLFFSILLAVLIVPASGYAQSIRFQVDPTLSQVRFTSKAPLRVVGKTNQIQGTLVGNLSSPSAITAWFSVTLADLDTGIKQRNKTMRDQCLETTKYPRVTFKLSKILSKKSIRPGEKTRLEVEGIFDLHGIKRAERLVADVLYDRVAHQLNIKAEFPLLLSNYQIKRPRILFLKFSDVIVLDLDIALASSQGKK